MELADRGAVPRHLDEAADGLDLWTHRAARKGSRAQPLRRRARDGPLLRSVPIEIDGIDVGVARTSTSASRPVASSAEGAVNAVIPYARAKINLRIHPEQDADEAQTALIGHLERTTPFGISLHVKPAGDVGQGFAATTSGPAYQAANAALATAWGTEPVRMASGGSIPLVNALHQAAPDAEILVFGAQDGQCNLHAPNERVLLDELEKAVIAEAEFFRDYAARKERSR